MKNFFHSSFPPSALWVDRSRQTLCFVEQLALRIFHSVICWKVADVLFQTVVYKLTRQFGFRLSSFSCFIDGASALYEKNEGMSFTFGRGRACTHDVFFFLLFGFQIASGDTIL
jgi:hypothetical protein